MNETTKRGGLKNFGIYILFNFIFGFLFPLAIIILDAVWVNIQGNETITTVQAVVFLVEAIILLALNEFLVCLVAKKAPKAHIY